MSRATLIFLLKALVSLGLLFFLLSRIDLNQFLRVLSSARLSYLLVALAAYFAGQLISAVRWRLLARPLGFGNPYREFALFYFIGMFFNLFAPSIIGGDVGRVFYLARGGAGGREGGWKGAGASAVIAVVAERAIGMAVLVWVGAAALLAFPQYSLPWAVRYSAFALALGVLFAWILLPVLHRFLRRREYLAGKHLIPALETYRKNYPVLLQTVALSLFVHCIQASMQILVGRSLGLEIPWSYCFILYPLVGIFSALPVSLNGVGLREGGYLFLLGQIGVGTERAIAFGLLWFLIIVLNSLIGGVVFILKKSPGPSSIASEMEDQAR